MRDLEPKPVVMNKNIFTVFCGETIIITEQNSAWELQNIWVVSLSNSEHYFNDSLHSRIPQNSFIPQKQVGS